MASAAEQMAANISLANFAKATDLKKRLWCTLGALIVFRLLSYVPLPGVGHSDDVFEYRWPLFTQAGAELSSPPATPASPVAAAEGLP